MAIPKLGWTPAPADPRTLRLSNYTVDRDLPRPPAALDWVGGATWRMLANDRIGNCVPVSHANHIQSWTTNAAGTPFQVTESDVIAAYSAISGYDPVTGAGDVGCRSLPALNHWRRVGVGGRRVLAYVQLDHLDLAQVRTALYLFGGLYVAALMPISAQTQFVAGRRWSLTRGAPARRGSWGGHAMHLGGYDRYGVTFVTWGRTQRATNGWWRAYVVEAYAVVSVDWINPASGTSPPGLDLDLLLADLRRVTT